MVKHVAFMCAQCKQPVPRIINFGMNWGGWRFQVECHNEVMQVEVLEQELVNATAINPYVKVVFTKKMSNKSDEPNVRFYCPKCAEVCNVFQYQYDQSKGEHVFMVTCVGRVCKGERTIARCGWADFQALRNVKSPVPHLVLLEPWIHLSPVHITHPDNAKPKMITPTVVTVMRPRRELRFE